MFRSSEAEEEQQWFLSSEEDEEELERVWNSNGEEVLRNSEEGEAEEEGIRDSNGEELKHPHSVRTLRSKALRVRYGDALTFAGLAVEVSLNPKP